MPVENELSRYKQIERGIRQGCTFSPDLFNLYIKHMMRDLGTLPGLINGGSNLNNIRYGDETILIAGTERELQDHLERVLKKREREREGEKKD